MEDETKRKIIVSNVGTHNGIKEIEISYDPFINKEYKPCKYSYVISKGKDEKEWSVYRKYYSFKNNISKLNKEYLGFDSLSNSKKYCIKALED